jgi:hypothetical protein
VNYIEQYQQLKDLFDLSKDEIQLPGIALTIRNMEYQSSIRFPSDVTGLNEDRNISENIRFRYPVIMPDCREKANKVIIVLHGLNERTWHKHLSGARFLAEKTGMAVILFPLSFHINRGLPEWTDVRKMSGPLEARKRAFPGIKEASLVNLALSERLTECPERFFISGLQSTMDLTGLIKEIKDGKHPLFEKNTGVDLFAYSISCMLLQSLMISNPKNILSQSKIILFAGGSLFSHMQGISKFIMDSVAYDTLRKFYLNIISKTSKRIKDFQPWIMEDDFGKAFSSILSKDCHRKEREKTMNDFSKSMLVIALKDDRIMPVEGIRQAVGEKFYCSGRFKVLHFPYAYTHENPFPVLYQKIGEQVEQAFQAVFAPALDFITQ